MIHPLKPDNNEIELSKLQERRMRFYAEIGRCVTNYQSIEDYLPEVFTAALGGEPSKATAIFAVARGLEAKIDIITAALTDRDEQHRRRWAQLARRIGAAASTRNQIAHATPVNNGGTIALSISFDPDVPTTGRRIAPPRMELHKRTRERTTAWTTELISDECRRTNKVFKNLIALAMELKGETPAAHLLEE